MSKSEPLLSICIPTNGVVSWVFPVLDSIYADGIDEGLFEVILTDNGNNAEFFSLMSEYAIKHSNLKYIKTNAYEFLNEIEAYKNANGLFIKFINHRTLLKKGTLQYFIDFVNKYKGEKPEVYFLNGELKKKNQIDVYQQFEQYVQALSYYSSWSTGMGFWKENFERIVGFDRFNVLFPHTDILFSNRKAEKYIIDNSVLLEEISAGKTPKGKYNLFNAFAVEYMRIILNLYCDGAISKQCFLSVKKGNLKFLRELYFNYIFLKRSCSYDLSDYKKSISVFYSLWQIKKSVPGLLIKKIFNKAKKLILGR